MPIYKVEILKNYRNLSRKVIFYYNFFVASLSFVLQLPFSVVSRRLGSATEIQTAMEVKMNRQAFVEVSCEVALKTNSDA